MSVQAGLHRRVISMVNACKTSKAQQRARATAAIPALNATWSAPAAPPHHARIVGRASPTVLAPASVPFLPCHFLRVECCLSSLSNFSYTANRLGGDSAGFSPRTRGAGPPFPFYKGGGLTSSQRSMTGHSLVLRRDRALSCRTRWGRLLPQRAAVPQRRRCRSASSPAMSLTRRENNVQEDGGARNATCRVREVRAVKASDGPGGAGRERERQTKEERGESEAKTKRRPGRTDAF